MHHTAHCIAICQACVLVGNVMCHRPVCRSDGNVIISVRSQSRAIALLSLVGLDTYIYGTKWLNDCLCLCSAHNKRGIKRSSPVLNNMCVDFGVVLSEYSGSDGWIDDDWLTYSQYNQRSLMIITFSLAWWSSFRILRLEWWWCDDGRHWTKSSGRRRRRLWC